MKTEERSSSPKFYLRETGSWSSSIRSDFQIGSGLVLTPRKDKGKRRQKEHHTENLLYEELLGSYFYKGFIRSTTNV